MLALESYARGTAYSMGAAPWAVFARLVLDGQAPATRGANFDFLACGRLFTYFRKLDTFGVNDGHCAPPPRHAPARRGDARCPRDLKVPH